MAIKVTRIDTTIERRILIGLIVSTAVTSQLNGRYRPDWFENSYAQKLSKWILDYFAVYKVAPNRDIMALVEQNRGGVPEQDYALIKNLIDSLDDEFIEGGINEDYVVDRALEYFSSQGLKWIANEMLKALQSGNTQKAQTIYESYRKSGAHTAQWTRPFSDPQFFEAAYSRLENPLLICDGKLGEFMGPMERGWLVALLAPAKKGKSFYLLELAMQALRKRLRVAFFSLEIKAHRLATRFYKNLTGDIDENDVDEREILIPRFDCRKNIQDVCRMRERTNHCGFGMSDDYDVCTACRGSEEFQLAISQFWVDKKHINEKKTWQMQEGFTIHYGDNFVLADIPEFVLSLDDIDAALDTLEFSQNFVPDVIIIDYADIVDVGKGKSSNDLGEINEVWKRMKGMAGKRNALVLSATQGKRESFDRKTIKDTDIGWNIQKIHHVDALYGISQSDEEKLEHSARLVTLSHRWREFNKMFELKMLQQLEISQPYLDGEVIMNKPNGEQGGDEYTDDE